MPLTCSLQYLRSTLTRLQCQIYERFLPSSCPAFMSLVACLVTILLLVYVLTSPASAPVGLVQSSASRISTLLLDFGFMSPVLVHLVQSSDSRISTFACSPRPRVKSAPPNLVPLSDLLCMTPARTTDFPHTSKSLRSKLRKHGSNVGLHPRLSTSLRISFRTKRSLKRLVASFKVNSAPEFNPATKLILSCLDLQIPLAIVSRSSFLFVNKTLKTIQVSGNVVKLVFPHITQRW
ncbi:hypothetical protein GOODEAATRI_029311 [Goodea atripinnis]|uniref:Uncharacterized protein n=1 Tax=Goodea atripinnis TaxID=208336 RepID=A0ABV0MLQ7_9TELE